MRNGGAAHQIKSAAKFSKPLPLGKGPPAGRGRETGVQTAYLHIRNRLRNEATVSSVSNIFLTTPYPPAPRRRPLSVKGGYSTHFPRHDAEESFPLISSIFLPGRKRFLNFARNDNTRGAIILHTSFTFLQKGASSRHSILRLWRAPSSRGCSAGMAKRTPNS